MRKLDRTNHFRNDPVAWEYILRPYQANTSTKRHARMMNALADLSFKINPAWTAFESPGPKHTGPNRAARRALQFGRVKPVAPAPEEPRKLTGAVRRGLERGRVA